MAMIQGAPPKAVRFCTARVSLIGRLLKMLQKVASMPPHKASRDGYICLFEAVSQFDGAVEDGLVRCAVRINGIVAEAFELVHGACFRR